MHSPIRKGIPPKIPEKLKAFGSDDPVHFRATPRSLPPQPSEISSSVGPAFRNYIEPATGDPVPPYMPMQGFNICSKRK